MAVRDYIKEIMQEYEEELANLKKERERVLRLFKEALRKGQIEKLKSHLHSHEISKSSK